MIDILKLADFRMSKGELSALRNPIIEESGDQLVRNFLQGLVKNTEHRTRKLSRRRRSLLLLNPRTK